VETVGRFELRRVLGRGGAGTVYEARDPSRGGRVALKIVGEKHAPTAARRGRFLREAQLASDLAHPNLMHVVETGEHFGRPFVAMELVEGVDLERVMRSGRPFPVEWTIDVLRQVCEGLHRAHVSGLFHGDLKPADIRVNAEGVVKILDFGMASLKTEDVTEDAHLLGGIHYRAPELIEGRKAEARSDVFSVGAIFFELLASRKPFPADTITGVMFRIRHDNADPGLLPATDFSPGLETIVMKALRREPGERYASLEEMRDELGTLVRDAAPRLARKASEEAAAAGPSGEAAGEVPAREGATLHVALERARASGESALALAIVRRLLDIDPEDVSARQVAEEIEAEGREAEAEQLCAIALAYAADGEVEKAAEIAEKIERLSPWSPRYLQLQVYLDEETARRDSEGLAQAAQDSLRRGDLQAALTHAEGALALFPMHRGAQDVRDRARAGLEAAAAAAADDSLAQDLEAALQDDDVPSEDLQPLESPSPPEAETRGPGVSVEVASIASSDLPPPPPPAHPAPVPDLGADPSSAPSRRADIEMLTSAALDRFLSNDHAGARRAASMALELDPANRKAKELLKILGAVGR
jgi:tetratricopeptide (TPR) repeat protein/predicted Ser/Thr protein kinase